MSPMHSASPHRSRRLGATVLGLLCALILTACGGFDSDDSSDGNGSSDSITIALNGEPSTLNPVYDISVPSLSVFRSVFAGLTAIDAQGDVQPSLAESWTSDETSTTWVFTLREDATFHDGSPVTAADVAFTFEQGMTDPEAATGSYVSRVDTVEATGEFEVTFHLNTPYAPFDRQVTLIPIVSKAAYEADPTAYGSQPIGAGPYQVEDWSRGDTMTLSRYDGYFGDEPAYEEVHFRFILDETTRSNALQSHDVDVAQVGASNVSTIEGTDGVSLVEKESNRVLYLGFNTTSGPLANLKVRQAIDMAINRDEISETLYAGFAAPSGQLVAPTTFGYSDDIEPTAFDSGEATSLLEDAGYDGTPITVNYPATELPQITQLAQAVAGYLEDIGLTVKLEQMETSNFRSAWLGNDFTGIYIWQFAPSIMDADLPLSLLAAPDSTRYFDDPQVDALMTEQIGITDEAERAATLGELLQLIHDQVYYSSLFTDVYTYGVSDDVEWTPRADGLFAIQ